MTETNHLDINYKFSGSGIPIDDFESIFLDEMHFSLKGNSLLALFFKDFLESNHWLEDQVP